MRNRFSALVKNFARDDRGASLVEYAILLGIMVAVGVTVFTTIGTEVKAKLVNACNILGGAGTCS